MARENEGSWKKNDGETDYSINCGRKRLWWQDLMELRRHRMRCNLEVHWGRLRHCQVRLFHRVQAKGSSPERRTVRTKGGSWQQSDFNTWKVVRNGKYRGASSQKVGRSPSWKMRNEGVREESLTYCWVWDKLVISSVPSAPMRVTLRVSLVAALWRGGLESQNTKRL